MNDTTTPSATSPVLRFALIGLGLMFILGWMGAHVILAYLSFMASLMANDSGTASSASHGAFILGLMAGEALTAIAGIPAGLAFFWAGIRKKLLIAFAGLFLVGAATQVISFVAFFQGASAAPTSSTTTPTPATADAATVRADGLYQFVNSETGFSDFLRFYPDGTVLKVTTQDTPEETAKWLNKELSAVGGTLKEQYRIEDSKVKFSSRGSGQIIEYAGVLKGSEFTMEMRNASINESATRIYNFVAVPGMQP